MCRGRRERKKKILAQDLLSCVSFKSMERCKVLATVRHEKVKKKLNLQHLMVLLPTLFSTPSDGLNLARTHQFFFYTLSVNANSKLLYKGAAAAGRKWRGGVFKCPLDVECS